MSHSPVSRRENPYMPRDNVLDNEAEAARPRHRRLTIKDSPHVVLSCASGFPHRIKFRKRVSVWPFNFDARLHYSRAEVDKGFQYGCSCRDALFGGGLHLDLAGRAVEYTKEITVGPISNLVVNGRCRYLGMIEGQPKLQPSFNIHVEMGRGAATWSGDGITFRQEVPVTRNVAFEVHGALKFPLPSVSYSSEHGHQGLGLGEGTYEMRLDQLNPCIRL